MRVVTSVSVKTVTYAALITSATNTRYPNVELNLVRVSTKPSLEKLFELNLKVLSGKNGGPRDKSFGTRMEKSGIQSMRPKRSSMALL